MGRYSSQLERLRTFDIVWSSTNRDVAREALAEAGFFYVGPGDTVRCFRCKVEIGDWRQGDEPKTEHLKHSPNCPFIKSLTEENVGSLQESQASVQPVEDPVESSYKRLYNKYAFADARLVVQQRSARYREQQVSTSSTSSAGASAAFPNVVGINGISGAMAEINVGSTHSQVSKVQRTRECSNSSRVEENSRSSKEVNSSQLQTPELNCSHKQMQTTQGVTEYSSDLNTIASVAKHPEYASLAARLQSFSSWPCPDIQEPRTLAEAGFYFTGRDDRVRCFACDGGLCNWAREDVPWYEHSKWYGNCPYVKDCQRHPVVTAIIDTARTLDSVQAASGCHHHHQGETQCDTESATAVTTPLVPTGHPEDQPGPSQTQTAAEPTESQVSETDLKSLQQENEEMKSSRMCKLCMESPVGVVFLPCSHLVCCVDCGLQLGTCPLSRGEIKATARVFV